MRPMLDTNVLIYGTAAHNPTASPKLSKMMADCKSLILETKAFCVSAITLIEYTPYLRADEAQAIEKLLSRVDIIGVTIEAARLASHLVREHGAMPEFCLTCLHFAGTKPCRKCKTVSSRAEGFNDFVIAASAALDEDTDVLYTYDANEGLVKSLAEHVRIGEPRSATPGLFEGVEYDDDAP